MQCDCISGAFNQISSTDEILPDVNHRGIYDMQNSQQTYALESRWNHVVPCTVPLLLFAYCSSVPLCCFFCSPVRTVPLFLCAYCSSDPTVPLFLCSSLLTVPLFLCAYCSPVALLLCSSLLTVPLCCSYCSPVPLFLLFLCAYCSPVPLILLVLCSSLLTVP